jgi:hypothetical protein
MIHSEDKNANIFFPKENLKSDHFMNLSKDKRNKLKVILQTHIVH